MLAGFRTFAKSPFAVVLFALLIISFAVFGISDVFKGPSTSSVVTAGARSLTPQDFKMRFDSYRKDAEQRSGQPMTPDMAVEASFDRQVLNELALQESFAEAIHRAGYRPSDKQIADQVRQQMTSLGPNQRPFDPITGKFDPKMYAALLAQNDLTPTSFEASLRDGIARTQVFSAVGNGLHAPRIYSAVQAAYALESRDLAAFAVNPTTVTPPGNPTDAQLTTFMKQNAERLTRPEFRVISIMRVSAQALEPTVKLDPAAVQKAFEQRKATLSAPETRSLVQIVAPDAKAAATIAQRLGKGEAPATVAAAFGVKPVILTDKPQTALPDRKVAEAAFRLAAGQVSAPVVGDLGISVIKLTKITPGSAPSLDSVRPAIEAELRTQNAQAMAYEQTQTYQDAHDGGADLVTAASKAGAMVMTTAQVTAQGLDETGQPVAGLTPDVLKTAFELAAGGESELIEAGKGEYYAVRTERVIAASMPPLAEIRPALTQFWLQTQMIERMREKATALAAQARKGASLESLAAANGSRVQRVPGLSRQTAQRYQALGRDFLVSAFGAKQGEVFTAQAGQGAFVVARLERVNAASSADLARSVQMLRPQTDSGMMQDLGEAARVAARTKLKTQTNLTLARQSIGVDTDALAKAEAAKSGKSGK
jgi:peptidyl-prolyl cis-trans isomerase D